MFSFSIVDFLLVLENYNLSIWPLQIFAYLLIIIALFFSFKSTNYSTKIVLSILSFFWLFNAIVFSIIFWSPSHIFGYIFGVFCFIQGILFIHSIRKSNIAIGYANKITTIIGVLFVIYATIGYQIFGYYLGHIYPKFFPVGLVPCPTTILTFGIFLIINNIQLKYIIIPLFISIGGFLAAYNGVYEDVGLIITGILGSILLIQSNTHFKKGNLKAT